MTPEQQAQLNKIIQDRLDNIDNFEPEDQAVIRSAAKQFNVQPSRQSTPLTPDNSASPFLGNFLDEVGQNVGSTVDGLTNLFHAATATRPPSGPGGPSALEQIVGNVGHDLRQQQLRAGQEMAGGHPLWGALRSIIGGVVPVAGPDVMNILDKSGSNPGAATADALGMGAQYLGPEVMKAFGAPARAVGKSAYKGSFDFGRDISLADRTKIADMGLDIGVPTTGQKSIDLIGSTTKPDSFLGGLEQDVQNQIKPVAHKQVNWNTVLKPLQDEINAIDPRASVGAANRRSALEDKLKQFKLQNGWRPATEKNPTGKPLNPVTVKEAQELKRTTYRLNSPSLYSDTAPLAPEEKASNVLVARGWKDSIEEQAPGVKPSNDAMHTAIQLQDQIVEAEKAHPGFMKTWLKWATGVGGAAVGGVGGAAAAAGHPMAGGYFLAGMAATQAARDPSVASRIGLALQHAGTDPASVMLGLSPAAGRVGQMLPPNSQQVDK